MFLIVESGDVRCALPLQNVVEIMRPLPVKHLPQTPAGVCGVALIRGLAQPVLDLSEILQKKVKQAGRFVSLRVNERFCALAVGAVIGIESIDEANWQTLPPLLKNVELARAISVLDRDVVLILETARIVPMLQSLPVELG